MATRLTKHKTSGLGARITPGWGIGLCLFIGVILLIVAWSQGETGLVEFSLSHAGVAFIVAGVVGIGYEIWSDRTRLQQQLDLIAAISRDTAEGRLENDIKALFPLGALESADKADLEAIYVIFREYLQELIDATNIIKKDVNERVVLLRFIAELIGYASHAAATLRHSDNADRRFALPKSATDVAAKLLAGHIEALEDGDSYYVISDFLSWDTGALDEFMKSMIEVLGNRRVIIQRVFARFSRDETIPVECVREILRTHWRLAASTPRYQLSVSSRGDYPHLGVFQRGGDLPMCFTFDESGDCPTIVFTRDDLLAKITSCLATAVPARFRPDDSRVEDVRFDEFCGAVTSKYPAFWKHYGRTGPIGAADTEPSAADGDKS